MECAVCYHEFDLQAHEARVWPCGHSTCRQCLATLVGQAAVLHCPQCRQPSSPEQVRSNFTVCAMLRERQERLERESRQREEPADALEMPRCRFHAHPVDVFCKSCGIAVCRACYATTGAPHATHDRVELGEAMQAARDAVAAPLGTAQARFQAVKQRVGLQHQEFQRHFQEVEARASTVFMALEQQLQMQKARVQQQLVERYEQGAAQIEQRCQQLQTVDAQLSAFGAAFRSTGPGLGSGQVEALEQWHDVSVQVAELARALGGDVEDLVLPVCCLAELVPKLPPLVAVLPRQQVPSLCRGVSASHDLEALEASPAVLNGGSLESAAALDREPRPAEPQGLFRVVETPFARVDLTLAGLSLEPLTRRRRLEGDGDNFLEC